MKTKVLQNLQTMKSLKKILIIPVLLTTCIDSVIKLEDEIYPQVNFQQCKFRLKKEKPVDFIDEKLEESSNESKIDTK